MDDTNSPVKEHQPEAAVFSGWRERTIILLFCLLAAVHVLIFSAAFPFFNNVDEQQHFDLVVKYSEGRVPRAVEPPTAETSDYIAVYNTFEYLWPSNDFPAAKFPPPWTLPMEKVAPMLASRAAAWNKTVNQESSQPPLYYAFAGAWWQLGKTLGLHDAVLLYLLRFINIFIATALVWLGYLAVKLIFPGNFFIRMGVPALVALIPQSAFYSIQNDALSPVCFGAAFILIIKFLRIEIPDAKLGAAVGLAIAATFLTKISNLPLLAVAGFVIVCKIFQLIAGKNWHAVSPTILSLISCAGLPIIFWLAWIKIHFGDWTGSAEKAQMLGWTLKPFSEWFHHPIFKPRGFWVFLSGNLETFWQGEILWHRKPLALTAANLFYALLSIIFIGATTFNLLRVSENAAQRHALGFALICSVASLGFFAFLSIIYDFHNCYYPSREHPYFTSGRLLLGVLIPFLLLFVYGLDRLLNRFGTATKFAALGLIILAMPTLEVATDWPVFFSQYNWFHM